jgi:hypothetical protein
MIQSIPSLREMASSTVELSLAIALNPFLA